MARRRCLSPLGNGDRLVEQAGSNNDWQVSPSVEFHVYAAGGDGDVGGHVEQVAEDLASLGVGVASHSPGEETIETAGDYRDQKERLR